VARSLAISLTPREQRSWILDLNFASAISLRFSDINKIQRVASQMDLTGSWLLDRSLKAELRFSDITSVQRYQELATGIERRTGHRGQRPVGLVY
jgi:hypothetical protein